MGSKRVRERKFLTLEWTFYALASQWYRNVRHSQELHRKEAGRIEIFRSVLLYYSWELVFFSIMNNILSINMLHLRCQSHFINVYRPGYLFMHNEHWRLFDWKVIIAQKGLVIHSDEQKFPFTHLFPNSGFIYLSSNSSSFATGRQTLPSLGSMDKSYLIWG